MRTLLILLSLLISSLHGSQKLNQEYAIYSKTSGFHESSVSKTASYIRFFSLVNKKVRSPFSSNISMQTQTVLNLEQYDKKSQKRQNIAISFFKNSHDITTLTTSDNISLLAALSQKNRLLLSYIDKKGTPFSSYVYPKYSYKKIYKIFKQEDGTFFILLQVSNANNQLSYFKRGLSKTDMQLLHLDTNLRPINIKHFGTVKKERFIGIVKYNTEDFKVITQKSPKDITVYNLVRYQDQITKTTKELPVEDQILTVSSNHQGSTYLAGKLKKVYKLAAKMSFIDLNLTQAQNIQNMSINQSNQWIISGTCRNKQGDRDGYIALLNSDFKTLWMKKFQTSFNDKTIFHQINNHTIDYFGTTFSPSSRERSFYLNISKRGYAYKPKAALSVQARFSKALKKKIGNKYQKYLDVLPSSNILVKNYYNPQSSQVSKKVLIDLKNFYKDFIDLISNKAYSKHIKKIFFNGYASSEWHTKSEQKRYLNNAKLSQERAFSLMKTLIESTQDRTKRLWLEKHIVLKSFSSSKTVKNSQNLENFEKSRQATLFIQWY